MMKASAASGNAVLAKARALYGRRLRADDYRRLMGCRTIRPLSLTQRGSSVLAHRIRWCVPTPAATARL